jgi:hypothetical protein
VKIKQNDIRSGTCTFVLRSEPWELNFQPTNFGILIFKAYAYWVLLVCKLMLALILKNAKKRYGSCLHGTWGFLGEG